MYHGLNFSTFASLLNSSAYFLSILGIWISKIVVQEVDSLLLIFLHTACFSITLIKEPQENPLG